MSTVNDLVIACRQQGVVIAAEGEDLRVEGPDEALTEALLSKLKDHKSDLLAALAQPANFETLLAEACQGVEGMDAAIFRALLSPEDVEDIAGGHIPMVTLNAYARSFAECIRVGKIKVLAAVIAKAILTARVRCGECRHFERDTIGDGSGIGRCKIGGEGTGPRYPALWPGVSRECKDFESREGRGMSKREDVRRYRERKEREGYRYKTIGDLGRDR